MVLTPESYVPEIQIITSERGSEDSTMAGFHRTDYRKPIDGS